MALSPIERMIDNASGYDKIAAEQKRHLATIDEETQTLLNCVDAAVAWHKAGKRGKLTTRHETLLAETCEVLRKQGW